MLYPSVQEGFRQERCDYDAAKTSKFRRPRRGIRSDGSGADYHYRSEADFLKLLEYARDLDRNEPIVGRMLNLAADATVQHGIGVQAKTGNDDLNDALDVLWQDWCDDPLSCDSAEKMTFGQLQHLAFRQMLADGDIFALALKSGGLQHFEAHRIRSPYSTRENKNVVHGVRLNKFRAPVEYWVTKEDVNPNSLVPTKDAITAIPARDDTGLQIAFHLYDPKRFTQTRGVSALVPIFDLVGMAGDIRFAKLVQAQMVSVWAWFIKRGTGWEPPLNSDGSPAVGARETSTRSDGTTETIENVQPGMIYRGDPGEELQAFSPATPNPEYFQQMREVHMLAMAVLGLPYMLVMLDASDTNFSGWRGAYDTAKLGWRRNQTNLITRYVAPIRRWKVQQWLDEDPALARLAARRKVRPYACKYNRPSYPYINPLQDATTDVMRLANLLTSPPRHFGDQGEDAYEIAKETIDFWGDQIAEAAARAKKINTDLDLEGPDRISWRDLLPKPNAQGLTVSMAANLSESAQQAPQQPAQEQRRGK